MNRKFFFALVLTLSSLITSTAMVGQVDSSISGIELKYRTPFSLPQGWVYVLVETSVFDGIEASLSQYATDLESIDGFSVAIYTVSTSDTTAIRSFLQQALPEGLVGCLLVGDVAEAYYEWVDWEGTRYYVPTDFFYMDLDGIWNDTDSDGAYDKHSGEVGAEIWLGSLQPSLVSGDDILLLSNYFEKNHLYRTGKLTLPKRALAYLDDRIWDSWWMEEWVNNTIKVAYNETVLVSDPEITIASDYKERLLEGYEWIYLATHGQPGSHTFWHHGYWNGTVYGHDYRTIDPPTLFYVLCACYTTSGYNNVAGSCVFTDTYGLLAIGSRGGAWKPGPGIVGYPWDFQRTEFYRFLSEGKCIGEAYLEDFKFYESMIIVNPEYEIPGYEYLWQIVGDPSLHIKGYPDIAPPVITILSPQNVTYTTNSIPLTFTVDEAPSWIGYSLDNQANVTVTGNTTLTGLSYGPHRVEVYANDTSGNMGSDKVCMQIIIPVTVDFRPWNRGKWIPAYIELPEGLSVYDIDVSTVKLNDTISIGKPTGIGDYDNDGIPDLMVKFNRDEVLDWLAASGFPTKGNYYHVTLTITGKLTDGIIFKGSESLSIRDRRT